MSEVKATRTFVRATKHGVVKMEVPALIEKDELPKLEMWAATILGDADGLEPLFSPPEEER
jgi:hypothetical protein